MQTPQNPKHTANVEAKGIWKQNYR